MKNKTQITWIFIAITIILAVIGIYIDRQNHKNAQNINKFQHSKIYIPNSQWTFLAKNSQSNYIDTLVLQDIEFDTNKSLTIYKWEFLNTSFGQKDENEKVLKIEIESFLNENNSVNLYFPTIGNLEFLKLFPNPNVSYPLYEGKYFTYNRKETKELIKLIKNKEVVINAEYKITDKIIYESNFLNDTCWVITTNTKTNQGNFNSKYYFNEKYGFVYLFYDFNDYNVELTLIDAKLPK